MQPSFLLYLLALIIPKIDFITNVKTSVYYILKQKYLSNKYTVQDLFRNYDPGYFHLFIGFNFYKIYSVGQFAYIQLFTIGASNNTCHLC